MNLLKGNAGFSFHQIDISDKDKLERVFKMHNINYVIHLAAQAGVRYSIENPDAYIQSNIIGTYNILEMCRHFPVKHLFMHQVVQSMEQIKKFLLKKLILLIIQYLFMQQLKKSNELMAYTYSHFI